MTCCVAFALTTSARAGPMNDCATGPTGPPAFTAMVCRSLNAADMFRAREYGAAAHDLARAVDHSRNAVRYDRPDPDLPPPSDDFGLRDTEDRARTDLYRAYDRLGWLGTWQGGAGIGILREGRPRSLQRGPARSWRPVASSARASWPARPRR